MNWPVRLARECDIHALASLIPLSAKTLQVSCYSQAQIEAALGPVFGVDRQLVKDGTYFVVEKEQAIIGCGGWSKRKSLFGGSLSRAGEDAELDPRHDAARIRAFFVHPAWARRGIARTILELVNERFAMLISAGLSSWLPWRESRFMQYSVILLWSDTKSRWLEG